LLDSAQNMHKDHMRIVLGSSSPKLISPRLVECTTVFLLHRFYNREWLEYLKKHIVLPIEHSLDLCMSKIAQLSPTQALFLTWTENNLATLETIHLR